MAYAHTSRGTVLEAASRERLKDARVLRSAGRYHLAVYVAGYAIECALKATIVRRSGAVYLQPVDYVHPEDRKRLEDLLVRADLLDAARRDRAVWDRWIYYADHWSTQMRYTAGRGTESASDRLVACAADLMDWLARY